MDKNKFKELWMNDEVESLEKEVDDGWRHGNYVYEIFKYKPDENSTPIYYSVSYCQSGDGEYHGIRENDFEIERVFPHKKVIEVITWESTPEEPKKD